MEGLQREHEGQKVNRVRLGESNINVNKRIYNNVNSPINRIGIICTDIVVNDTQDVTHLVNNTRSSNVEDLSNENQDPNPIPEEDASPGDSTINSFASAMNSDNDTSSDEQSNTEFRDIKTPVTFVVQGTRRSTRKVKRPLKFTDYV